VISFAEARAWAGPLVWNLAKPHIEDVEWGEFAEALDLSQDQQAVVDALFDRYRDDLERHVHAGYRRVMDAGLAEIEAAQSAGEEIPDARLAELFESVQDEMLDVVHESDALTSDLVEAARDVLTEEQLKKHFPSAERRLRRRVHLQSFRESVNWWYYAGEGFDVFEVVDGATAPGGELEWLRDDSGVDPGRVDPQTLERARQDVREELDVYARGVDRFIQNHWRALRRLPMRAEREHNDGDARHARLAMADAFRRWGILRRLNERVVEKIAEQIKVVRGPDAAHRWSDRYMRFAYPALTREETPDRMFRWLAPQLVDENLVNEAEQIYDDYLDRRRRLWRMTADAVEQVRRDRPGEITPRPRLDDPTLPRELREVLELRHALATTVLGRLRTVAAAAEHEQEFDAHLERIRHQPDDSGWPIQF